MVDDPILACVVALNQAGWHVSPAASPWPVTTEIHADLRWSPQLVDTAVLSTATGQAVAQRIKIIPTQDTGQLQHEVLAHTGPVPAADLPAILADWPPPELPATTPSGPPSPPPDQ
jgi:hypothetical protein